MWFLFLFVVLLLLDVYLVYTTREPPNLTLVKERYQVLVDHINSGGAPKKFDVLGTPLLITNKPDFTKELGYNSNKGLEIGLSTDSDPNDIFHVLIHELCHSTVEEYDHSEQFWENFNELQDICSKLGIYNKK
jgi:hypothetical protein